jgi:hypothetical protein
VNPVHLILNSGFICALITFSALQSHADERIIFDQVAHESTYAKVSCIGNRDVSKSLNTKYGQRYRAYLTPRQIKRLIEQEQFIDFENISSAARVKAYGDQALAMVTKTEIAVTIKSSNNKKVTTSLFRWASRGQKALITADRALDQFSFYDQGETDCKAKSPNQRSQTCYFGAQLNTRHDMDQLSHYLAEAYSRNPGEDLIIEVFYRHFVYVDCSGRRSQAIVRGGTALPKVYLRDAR